MVHLALVGMILNGPRVLNFNLQHSSYRVDSHERMCRPIQKSRTHLLNPTRQKNFCMHGFVSPPDLSLVCTAVGEGYLTMNVSGLVESICWIALVFARRLTNFDHHILEWFSGFPSADNREIKYGLIGAHQQPHIPLTSLPPTRTNANQH